MDVCRDRGHIVLLQGDQIEMSQRHLLRQELWRRQRDQGRAQFEIALTGVTGSEALLLFLAFDLERAQETVIAVGTEGEKSRRKLAHCCGRAM